MAEFEELKLVVSLTDNASAGLRALNADIEKFGNVVSKPSVTKLNEFASALNKSRGEIGGLAVGLRNTLSEITRFNQGVLTRGQSMGVMGRTSIGGLLGVPALIAGVSVALEGFARQMIDLQNKARAGAILPDHFRSIAQQLEIVGYQSEQAQQELGTFVLTGREGSRAGTPEFQALLRTGGVEATVFAQNLQKLINSGQVGQAITAVAREAQKLYAKELARPGGTRAEATRQAE